MLILFLSLSKLKVFRISISFTLPLIEICKKFYFLPTKEKPSLEAWSTRVISSGDNP
jgi:hypothetical protein